MALRTFFISSFIAGALPISAHAEDEQTALMVERATAFLSSLSDTQRSAVLFDFDDDGQRSNWTNFPDPIQINRGGIKTGSLDDAQSMALYEMLSAFLSEEGVRNVVLQLAADDAVAILDAEEDEGFFARLFGGGGGPNFGSDHYFVSFLGVPHISEPWMMQFGGHHLAINATVVGADVSFSPMLTGGEPLTFAYEGENVSLAGNETAAANVLLASLSDDQRAQAILSTTRIELLLGPEQDGTTAPYEGIAGSALSEDQKGLLVGLIDARLGMINEDDLAPLMEDIRANLDETFFGWWGPEDADAAYFRVTGPTVVIEYASEEDDLGGTNHAHNIYRDLTNDYGADILP